MKATIALYDAMYKNVCSEERADETDWDLYRVIYHKDGKLIATDGLILCEVRCGYTEKINGLLIAEDGKEYTDTRFKTPYPDYDSIISVEQMEMFINCYLFEAALVASLYRKDAVIQLEAGVEIICNDLIRASNVFRSIEESPMVYVNQNMRNIVMKSTHCTIAILRANKESGWYTIAQALTLEDCVPAKWYHKTVETECSNVINGKETIA